MGFAAQQMQQHGRRKAAQLTREKFNITFSSSTARRAAESGGEPPGRRGAALIIPGVVERRLEDLCLVLRELNLPVYRFMVLNYVNRLVEGTDVAERLKDKEVKRLQRLSRLRMRRRAGATHLRRTSLAVSQVMMMTCEVSWRLA